MTKAPVYAWHAVSVLCGADSCEAVRALKGRRFLSRDAPRLPLKDCQNPERCICTFRKFADRRAGPRRADEQGGIRRAATGAERRAGRGRRQTDE